MDYRNQYKDIEIVDDPTLGLIKLGLIDRIDSDRKTKITNNFVSQTEVLDPHVLKTIVEMLNAKLPPPQPNEKILGLEYSGIPMSTALAMVRGSNFNFSTSKQFGNYQDKFSFSEEHRQSKKHYFYGLNKSDLVVIIEDEVTSGKGLIALINALKNYGVTVLSVCTAIETLSFGARENIKKETGIDLISLVKINVRL